MTRFMLALGLLVVLALANPRALSAPPSYRGPGGQLEAAGVVAGAYMLTAANIEHCTKNPVANQRAMRSAREYLNKNQQHYMDMMRKLPELAFANGGDAEVKRLKRELEVALTDMESEAKARVRSPAPSNAECAAFLDAVDRGMYDLRVRYNNELTRILR